MTSGRSGTVSDDELLRRVLARIGSAGEVIESDLYDLTGTRKRIRPILDMLYDRGFLDVRTRERGQRVPVYRFTDRGLLLLHADSFRNAVLDGDAAGDSAARELADVLEGMTTVYGWHGRRDDVM